MPATAAEPTTRKFHFGLGVADLDRAVEFYRTLLGAEPVKHYDDYAKFDVEDPPIVLALHPSAQHTGGALNHVGFRVVDSAKLVAVQERLELSGIRTQREEGVECCYALQTKFWVPDLDGNLWEIYALHDDLDHSGFGGDGAGMPPKPQMPASQIVWEHFVTSPLPERIPHGDGEVWQVNLEGTFNAKCDRAGRASFLKDMMRVLAPGGTVRMHGLVSNRPFPGVPKLPGPAAMVQQIPVETEPADELLAAGFTGLSYDKFGDIHCLGMDGLELRELQLSARKPMTSDDQRTHFVLYKGPLERVTDDRGQTFIRGERKAVDAATWEQLSVPPFDESFTCFRCSEV